MSRKKRKTQAPEHLKPLNTLDKEIDKILETTRSQNLAIKKILENKYDKTNEIEEI